MLGFGGFVKSLGRFYQSYNTTETHVCQPQWLIMVRGFKRFILSTVHVLSSKTIPESFFWFLFSNLEDKIQPSLETWDDRPEEPDEGIWDPRNRPPPSYLSWVCEPTSQLHMRTLSPWRPVSPVTRDVTISWRKWWRNWQQTLTSIAFSHVH